MGHAFVELSNVFMLKTKLNKAYVQAFLALFEGFLQFVIEEKLLGCCQMSLSFF